MWDVCCEILGGGIDAGDQVYYRHGCGIQFGEFEEKNLVFRTAEIIDSQL